MENCIFCKIANGEIPSATLYEDEDFRVILDLGPASKGHSLILPKSHAANVAKIPRGPGNFVQQPSPQRRLWLLRGFRSSCDKPH